MPRHSIVSLVAVFALACSQARVTTFRARDVTWVESDVRYPAADVELAAALLMPDLHAPLPGAVILQGSGESDRSNDWSRQFAEGLASRGIAVLLSDKRGCGRSGGDWKHASFGTLAADGVAGVEELRRTRGVARNAVGVVGLSQGGMVAPAAAALSRHVAFVVDVSGAATTAIEQVDHEMRNTFRNAGLEETEVAAGMRLQALATAFVRTGDWEPYRRALDEALAGPLRSVASGYPQDRGSWVWDFWRLNQNYDPLTEWRRTRRPALIVYGAHDERDNVPVRRSVERLRALAARRHRPWKIEVFADAGHALFLPDIEPGRVRPDVLDLIADEIERIALANR